MSKGLTLHMCAGRHKTDKWGIPDVYFITILINSNIKKEGSLSKLPKKLMTDMNLENLPMSLKSLLFCGVILSVFFLFFFFLDSRLDEIIG